MVVARQTMRRNSLSYSILASYDRDAIKTLNNFGYSLQKIADTLGFSKSTIHYELQTRTTIRRFSVPARCRKKAQTMWSKNNFVSFTKELASKLFDLNVITSNGCSSIEISDFDTLQLAEQWAD